MHSAYALLSRWTAYALFIVVIASRSGISRSAEPETGKSKAKRAAEIVDAIANCNKAPKIIKWRGNFPSKAALFPEDHDWKEEVRVRRAIGVLEADETKEVWEELVKRAGDHHYCDTVTSVKTGDAYIEDIGDVCCWIAYSRLIGVFWQHMPRSPVKDGEKLSLDVGIGDITEWRKQRAAKSLYELQIEVCEEALKELSNVKDVPQNEKNKARRKIEAEIERLKSTKQHVSVLGGHTFRERGRYNAELAKRVREEFKNGNFGNLGIIK
jgi:hypothetical protein